MRKLSEVFRLEMRALRRSHTLSLLAAAIIAWVCALPHVLHGDGTPEGALELYIRYALGGAFALTVVSLVACATGSLAKERAERRLQLTMVKPVRYFAIVAGKALALCAAGAGAVTLAAAVLLLNVGGTGPGRCNHVLKPVMESPRAEAEKMYAVYMADPETPEQVKKAPRAVVMRILTQRAVDHYQTVGTNETALWRFALPAGATDASDVAVRLRFTNMFEARQDVKGLFTLGDRVGAVTNITQAVITVPLVRGGTAAREPDVLGFRNGGTGALMLRPRRDVDLLLPADSFWRNLVRAALQLVAMLTVVIVFGVFLGATLGRPVAVFTAVVLLLVTLISPSVIEQYPDELESDTVDRIGLWITRTAERATKPLAAYSPIESLSRGECVEWGETLAAWRDDVVAIPLILVLLAAFLLPRKQENA